MGQDTETANAMGLFLQKTNIIRDYLEDFVDGRTWWPEEVWAKYAPSLGDLAKPSVPPYQQQNNNNKNKEKKKSERRGGVGGGCSVDFMPFISGSFLFFVSSLVARSHAREAVACLNELITDALQLVPSCFTYMSRLRDQTVFNFCAIPQVRCVQTTSAPFAIKRENEREKMKERE